MRLIKNSILLCLIMAFVIKSNNTAETPAFYTRSYNHLKENWESYALGAVAGVCAFKFRKNFSNHLNKIKDHLPVTRGHFNKRVDEINLNLKKTEENIKKELTDQIRNTEHQLKKVIKTTEDNLQQQITTNSYNVDAQFNSLKTHLDSKLAETEDRIINNTSRKTVSLLVQSLSKPQAPRQITAIEVMEQQPRSIQETRSLPDVQCTSVVAKSNHSLSLTSKIRKFFSSLF